MHSTSSPSSSQKPFPHTVAPDRSPQFSLDQKGVGMDGAKGLVFQALLEIGEGERLLWTWSYFLLVIPSVPGQGVGGLSESCLLLPEA